MEDFNLLSLGRTVKRIKETVNYVKTFNIVQKIFK